MFNQAGSMFIPDTDIIRLIVGSDSTYVEMDDGCNGTHATHQHEGEHNGQVASCCVAAKRILEAIPLEDAGREGLKGTPLRFAKAFKDLTSGYSMSVDGEVGNGMFDEAHEDMILVKDIPVYSLCEHHMLPFFGHVNIAYIPGGKILGLSKFNRVVEIFSRRLQVQERLTTQIAEAIDDLLSPAGVVVCIQCRHLCMEMRGVKEKADTVTIAKRGVFKDAGILQQFYALNSLHSGSTRTDHGALANLVDCGTVDSAELSYSQVLDRDESNMLGASIGCGTESTLSDSAGYRLFMSCAPQEATLLADFIKESVVGPLSRRNPAGISLLDIGAGDGAVLKALSDALKLSRYCAFEKDTELCNDLAATAVCLGFNERTSTITSREFDTGSTLEDAGGRADVVLLSHCLYGVGNKEELVEHAFNFVTPGGILLIVHRWEPNGTLDRLSDWCLTKKVLHFRRVWESRLDLSTVSAAQRMYLHRYTNGVVPLNENDKKPMHAIGCISIEPNSCSAGRKDSAIHNAQRRVSYFARRKSPELVVTPNSITGIQACLYAAIKHQLSKNGKVSVIGGGHSENGFDDGAIAIDMQLWDRIDVDPCLTSVKVGGGAKIGDITRKCEQHGVLMPLGDRPGIGVGLILQGGLNHFMRKYGLASDNILAVTYVDPCGTTQVASTTEELFLFRGAGSNFGVVLELTMRVFPIESLYSLDIRYDLSATNYDRFLTAYSSKAATLPPTESLDSFLYWSTSDQVSFSTVQFSICSKEEPTPLILSTAANFLKPGAKAAIGEQTLGTPSQLFDRELYMTDAFSIESTLPSSQKTQPNKLRCSKRCVLLPALQSVHEAIMYSMVRDAPTKWTYVHLLHGGEAVNSVPPEKTAFGCRKWQFAAVITARWPDGDMAMERKSNAWLDEFMKMINPYSEGVYASDLGPHEIGEARRAFGLNSQYLANMKRKMDPLNVLGAACNLIDGNDPRVLSRGMVVVLCGRRHSGKDWLGSIVAKVLTCMLGGPSAAKPIVKITGISEEMKRDFANETEGVDFDKLTADRRYKEKYRKALTTFYARKRAIDPAYDARCYVNAIQRSNGGILLLTGMRDGLDYARRVSGKPVVLVKVDSSVEAKSGRGWEYDRTVDESQGERVVDAADAACWDLVYDNGTASDDNTAELWVKEVLAPTILKNCTRTLANTPRMGVKYRDIVGSLLLHRFALPLWNALVFNWLERNGGISCVDVIVVPEALSYILGGSLACQLQLPVAVIRKAGKIEGARDRTSYEGSNMQELKRSKDATKSSLTSREGATSFSFEIVSGSIIPGQRVLIVDDCLASGRTVSAVLELVRRQGGVPSRLAFLMELPDLHGRPQSDDLLKVYTAMQFPGE